MAWHIKCTAIMYIIMKGSEPDWPNPNQKLSIAQKCNDTVRVNFLVL